MGLSPGLACDSTWSLKMFGTIKTVKLENGVRGHFAQSDVYPDESAIFASREVASWWLEKLSDLKKYRDMRAGREG